LSVVPIPNDNLNEYFSLNSKQPDFYKKNFGHLADDTAIQDLGKKTLTYVADIITCLKDGNDDGAVDKINSVCIFLVVCFLMSQFQLRSVSPISSSPLMSKRAGPAAPTTTS
jgi:hypothetical protein